MPLQGGATNDTPTQGDAPYALKYGIAGVFPGDNAL